MNSVLVGLAGDPVAESGRHLDLAERELFGQLLANVGRSA